MLASTISTKMAEKLKLVIETHYLALNRLVLIQGGIFLCPLPVVKEMPISLCVITGDIAEAG